MGRPAETIRIAAKLMRETTMTGIEVAARTGVTSRTISDWNRRYGWRQTARDSKRRLDPRSWGPARRMAVARLYAMPEVAAGTLAVALGGTVSGASALFRACGFGDKPRARPGRPSAPDESLPPAPLSGEELDSALREHIGRQIARFDAALAGDAPPALDSAKVLRDLGGLKRLLDDLASDEREWIDDASRFPADDDEDDDDEGDDGSDALPALRAAIAARYAACLGERPDAGLPGEPAAEPDPRAGLGLAP
ncbi:hypothetical protein [Methylobacterium marchantiae]|uniref:Homeodomain-like domain-containing protein n=1 Tax=Methylobacterium marchantiae TaxID=600331 RepID=A0ABW3WYX7_9HYPH|nr:hypothetical protein AIGOOFII_4057 [Methylobacterium marchantiae]